MTEYVFEAVGIVLSPELLTLIVVTALVGIVLGSIPGIGPTLAMVLLFPFTFVLEPTMGLAMMAVVYGAATYGGSISAILVNIPGTPGSAATLLDGYPLTQKGRAAFALGVGTMSSFVGAVIGLGFLVLFAPFLADLSLLFGPPEFFMLALLGLSIVAAVTRGSLMKSFAAVCLGVLFASVGTDPIRASPRYVFDTYYLQGGIDLVVLLVGLFAVSQAIQMAVEPTSTGGNHSVTGDIWKGARTALDNGVGLVRGSVIGTLIGSVPGVGIAAANFFSYLVSVKSSKDPESFGTGDPRGVIAAESANNASAMGALVPAMALAIPGGAAAAVFIGVMITYGITPGPDVFDSTPLPYVIFISILLGAIVVLGAGLFAGPTFARVTRLPDDILLAGILCLALGGSFAVRNNVLDVVVAVLIGIMAYTLDRNGYSLIAFVMGFILAPIAEGGFQRALRISEGSYLIFVTRPLSATLLALSILTVFLPILVRLHRS